MKKAMFFLLVLSIAVVLPAQSSPPSLIPDGFVLIDGGTFTMGSPVNEPGRYEDETQHQVTVSSFYMGKYEVTEKEYDEIIDKYRKFRRSKSEDDLDDLPVTLENWFDVIEYCNARSQEEGLTPAYTIDKKQEDPNNQNSSGDIKWLVTWNRNANGYRLPTEAEWEYACRAGTTTAYNTGAEIDGNAAWYSDNIFTQPVGQKRANDWGLYDMHGNLFEYCWDWYGTYPDGAQTDPVGKPFGAYRVFRGGGFGVPADILRSAGRYGVNPSTWTTYIGFRLARNVQ